MLRQLTLLRPDGSVAALPFEQRAFQNFAMSPDGNALLATIYDQGAADLWVGDMARGTLTRLTSGEGVVDPIWSQDGREALFASTRSGAYKIYRMAVDGSSPASVVSSLTDVSPASERGGFLLAQRLNPGGDGDILRIRADGSWEPWLATRTTEGLARIAPDGRWVVYAGNASGRSEVYRRRLEGGPSQQISTEGGEQPHWSPDGRYVYFINRAGLFRVDTAGATAGSPELVHGAPEMLMARPSPRGLVMLTALEETRPLTAINVVGNWLAEVTPRLPR
jgi:Tol biopolymer transport system component